MAKWAVTLTGDSTDLQFVSKFCQSSHHSILKEKSKYLLVFDDMDKLQDKYNISVDFNDTTHRKYGLISLGRAILKDINSIASLQNPSFRTIGVHDQEYVKLDDEMKISERYVHFADEYRGPLHVQDDTEFDNYMEVMDKNKYFKEAMDIFSKGRHSLTFSDLYNIKELFDNSGDREKVLTSLADGAAKILSSLGLVAQSKKAVGDEARHRKPGYDKQYENAGFPSSDKEEYINLIRSILLEWVKLIISRV